MVRVPSRGRDMAQATAAGARGYATESTGARGEVDPEKLDVNQAPEGQRKLIDFAPRGGGAEVPAT